MSRSSPAAENKLASMARRGPKGENRLARMATDAAGSGFMRGLTALPYRLLGAPVDLADMVVRPIANAAGIPIAEPENMYGTSDWMIKHAVNNGLLMPRTGSGAEMGGDFLGQIAAPGVGPGEAAAAKAIFAGPLALTADLEAMRRAQSRLEAGEDAAKVWADEGWFRGPDGKMRFEIDDSGMTRVDPVVENKPAGWAPRSVGEGFSHPGLAAAYPEIQAVRLEGGFFPGDSTGAIYGAYQRPGDGYEEMLFVGGPNETQRSTAAHEIQHSIQHREGFAGGGGSDSVFAYEAPEVGPLNDAVDALEARLLRMTPLDPEWGSVSRELKRAQAAAERMAGQAGYRRLAGEAEARAVQARLPLTAEQRRARYPLQDYDVPLNELIIR